MDYAADTNMVIIEYRLPAGVARAATLPPVLLKANESRRMSLLRFVRLPDVRERLDAVIPEYDRRIKAPLVVPPSGAHAGLVGTAFDYALRMEIERKAPHANRPPWIAEHVLESFHRQAKRGRGSGRSWAQRLAEQIEPVVLAAQRAVRRRSPARVKRFSVALVQHAVRLAKLDPWYRALYLDHTFERADPPAVRDVCRLLESTPLEWFLHGSVVLLNPTFGRHSLRVGGADADLIVGDRLIDLKTTVNPFVEREAVRQLVGYFLLAEALWEDDPKALPRLSRLTMYYARYSYFVHFECTAIRSHPLFAKTKRWFFLRARAGRRSRFTPVCQSRLLA